MTAIDLPDIDFELGIGAKEALILGCILVTSACLAVAGVFDGDNLMTIIGMIFAYGFGRAYGNGKLNDVCTTLTAIKENTKKE